MDKVVLDHNRLKEILDREREAGKRVVFTNGCFDVLHVGHIRCLKDAKALADILVVALNSDASVQRFKYTRGTYTPEMERAEIVAALEPVDYVTFFSDPTVDNLLTLLKPDIHAKGTDYTEETVPERETVLAYGGKIAIVGDPKTHSSSEIKGKLEE